MFKKTLFIIFILYHTAYANVKINSVIKLQDNVPNECGLQFLVDNDSTSFDTKLSIKKLESNETVTFFSVESEKKISKAELTTSFGKINEMINVKNQSKTNYIIVGKTNVDSMTFFFQDLLINGGQLNIDKKTYQIKGPIDSKVRLEYLFCTGEMFLPNYNKKNE